MAKRELQFDDGKSRKFWKIKLTGTSHTVTFGRIGTPGQTRTKEFESKQEAKTSCDKLIQQKLAKGYDDAKTVATAAKKKTKKKAAPAIKVEKKVALSGKAKKATKNANGKRKGRNKGSKFEAPDNSVDANSSPAAKRRLMTKRRYFENPAGCFWEIRLMSTHQQTWEGKSGEQASGGGSLDYPNRAIAETKYFALVQKHVAQGYREMKKPLLRKRARPARKRKSKTALEPVSDALLGQVRYDALTKCWEGALEINGVKVAVSFCELESELEPAKKMARLLKRRITSITKGVARDVHPYVYDDVDPRPTLTELTAGLQLYGVNFSDGVGAECFFGGQEFFGAHDVVVWVGQNGSVGEGHLAG